MLNNLFVLSNVENYGNVRIVATNDIAWPAEPDLVPIEMKMETHALMLDNRWSWFRPVLRLLTGDSDYALVNFLKLMTRNLDSLHHNEAVRSLLPDAIAGLRRLQDSTYSDNKFVKLALITTRCSWESLLYEKNQCIPDL